MQRALDWELKTPNSHTSKNFLCLLCELFVGTVWQFLCLYHQLLGFYKFPVFLGSVCINNSVIILDPFNISSHPGTAADTGMNRKDWPQSTHMLRQAWSMLWEQRERKLLLLLGELAVAPRAGDTWNGPWRASTSLPTEKEWSQIRDLRFLSRFCPA